MLTQNIATWSVPCGFSASNTNHIDDRIAYYSFHSTAHYLGDGTRIVPTKDTALAVIQAFDEFGADFPVVISSDSYEVLSESDAKLLDDGMPFIPAALKNATHNLSKDHDLIDQIRRISNRVLNKG